MLTVEFLVGLGDRFLDGLRQRGEVVPVREISSLDWWQDSDLGVTGIEEFAPGCRYAIGSFNDDGEDGKSGVDGDTECSLLEGKQLIASTPCPLREHDQGMAAFGREVDAIDDRLPAGAPSLPIDFDDADPAHGRRDERDLEQFLFCKKPSVDRQNVEEQGNVEGRKVIGNNDIAGMWIDMLEAFDTEMHRRHAEEDLPPTLHDPPEDRRGWSEDAVHDDECGVGHREHEEQGNKDERAGSCDQRLWHVGSVGEMGKAAM